MPDLLYEIGVEEIPAGYIAPALEQLERAIVRELEAARLTHGAVRTVATPRRLVLAVSQLIERQPDAEEDVMGPPVRAAYDAKGNPTKAGEGFARSQGVDVSQIVRRDTPRGEYCCIRKQLPGRPAAEVLAEILPRITLALSFPKSMVWLPERKPFARPVRWLLALLGDQVIPFRLFDVDSGRSTEGHPILAPGRLEVADADFASYAALLRKNCIVVDMADRKAAIRADIEKALAPFGGPFREEALLEEVTNLVQWPSVAVGSFDPIFLEVPAAVVEAAMMEHQRYFPVRDAKGALCPNFLVVSDRGAEKTDLIRRGNEQVLRARLSDAQFFDRKDRQTRLESRVEALNGVAFLKGLGNYLEKTRRLECLAAAVAGCLGLAPEATAHAVRAARLCKADLLTEMVGEFPALQGRVGRIYAQREGEPREVAAAIEEHYLPRSADGELPQAAAGRALSLAEKMDNLVSCFALKFIPTGSQDPYALRRQSQGALRIIEDSGRHFEMSGILRAAQEQLAPPHNAAADALPRLMDFLKDRLFQMALDRGAPHDLIHATLAAGFDDVCDFWLRLAALRELAAEPAWQDVVTSVERTSNISRNGPADGEPRPDLYREPLEKELGALLRKHRAEIEELESSRRYVEASRRYAEVFAKPLHEFFDTVFVNVEDMDVRNNRLRLLRDINRLYSARIADLSQIVTGVQK